MSAISATCPNCHEAVPREFYRVEQVPTHSMLVLRDRAAAQDFPRGDIALGFCGRCGFVTNLCFDPGHRHYEAGYESSQAFSETFNAFHRALARDLVHRYGLRGKTILEIGCGEGQFLKLLCEAGDNRGIGFDPAYRDAYGIGTAGGRIRVIADYYSEAWGNLAADLICCKQTLEHIPDTAGFVGCVRRAIGGRRDTRVFFQVPDFLRIVREGAFWDVYYEHCSYFTKPSLSGLFRASGFDVIDSRVGYDGQYLMVEAEPRDGLPDEPYCSGDVEHVAACVHDFARRGASQIARWREELSAAHLCGRRTVLWGAGSKAVAFLTTLGVGDEVACAVDINTGRQGSFLAGTGHQVVAPEQLTVEPPDRVIVMNPIYMAEIRHDLDRLGLRPALIPVNAFTEPGRMVA